MGKLDRTRDFNDQRKIWKTTNFYLIMIVYNQDVMT